MSLAEGNIYADPTFRQTDIGSVMRVGHPDIAAGDAHITSVIAGLRRTLGRPLRILDVGSGSGDLSLLLAAELPDCTVIANEIEDNPLEQARAKLAGHPRARVFGRPFEEFAEEVDVVVSWGSHHHLRHDYLDHVRSILSADGLLIIGDEFCPEYLTPADRERVARADTVTLLDGYIFTDQAEIASYRSTGKPPEWSLRMEEARRQALWRWYKFVGDFAADHGAWDVLITELQIARDDLRTAFDGEHKTSPYLLERELALGGFAVEEVTPIGGRPEALSSFVIYTARVDAALAEGRRAS